MNLLYGEIKCQYLHGYPIVGGYVVRALTENGNVIEAPYECFEWIGENDDYI